MMLIKLVEMLFSHFLFLLNLFWYVHSFFEGVLLPPFAAILLILDLLVWYLVYFRELLRVDFIALRISFMAPFWAASRSFICLGECIDCPHIIVPYSNFKQIKYLYIYQLGMDACQWSRLSNYMLACFFLVMFSTWGVK